MRFPIRDLVPTQTAPILTWIATAPCAIVLLTDGTGAAFVWAGLTALAVRVLGETVEDQLGRVRFGFALVTGALCVTTMAGRWDAAAAGAGMAAIITGIHTSLFPLGRVALSMYMSVLELPSLAVTTAWLASLLWGETPPGVVLLVFACAAAAARLIRRRERKTWDYLDRVKP